jgi:hypothetical protein
MTASVDTAATTSAPATTSATAPGTAPAGTDAGAAALAHPAVPGGTAPTATRAQPVAPPSVHIRALATWLVIFPHVALGMTALAPVSADWPPVLRAFVLTIVIVPLAVYLAVPQLLRGYGALRAANAKRASRR